MGLFDDLTPKQGPKGLFGDLVPAKNETPNNPVGEVVRQVGLTARYGLEGIPQVVDFAATPFKYVTDKAVGAATGKKGESPTLSNMGTQLSDWLGLPPPKTAQERVVADATRTGFGAMGGAGAAKTLAGLAIPGSTSQAVASSMAANPGTQAISGAGAGTGAGVVRENGGSPLGQTIAAVAGGVAAPMGARLIQNMGESAITALRKNFTNPQMLDATLKAELAKTGVNWDEIGAQAKMQLRQDAAKAVYSGQPLDSQALRRLSDYRTIGATPLVGDITQDPGLVTQQRNLTKQLANISQPLGGESLPAIDNNNAKKVLSTLGQAATSPLDEYATGQGLINKIGGKDAALGAAETADYQAARAAAGRDIPLDRAAFVKTAFDKLANSNRGSFLPKEIETLLNQISTGEMTVNGQKYPVPFNVDTIDQLKTVLGSASRASNDGNVKAAISAVRDALEGASPSPIKSDFGGSAISTGPQAARMQAADALPEEAMRLFDTARSNARGRRQWQESAGFIEDALSGAAPDKFAQKHIIGATVEDLGKLKAEISKDPELMNATRKQLVDYVLKRGGGDGDVVRFSSKGMEDGLKALGDRKLALFFEPEEIQQIKAAVNVGKYMQAQPIGSAVQNSNSAAMALGRLSDLLMKGSGIPGVGPMVADPLRNLTLRAQSIPLRDLSSGLTQAKPMPGPRNALVPLSALLAAPAIDQGKDDRRP